MTLAARDLAIADRLGPVSYSFPAGQVTAICGPNGAGKSTLLTSLAGLLGADSGQVELDGESLAVLPAKDRARRIGYLPQDGEVAWNLSVRNLVALGRMPHGDRDNDAVDAAMRALEIEAFANRPVDTLSGGERARALLARVLAGQPQWILADEPLAALDLAHQLALLAHLRAVADGGAGVLMVLHDLTLAMNHADRVVVLDKGRIACTGSPDEALGADTLARVWGVEGRWVGEPGARALVVRR